MRPTQALLTSNVTNPYAHRELRGAADDQPGALPADGRQRLLHVGDHVQRNRLLRAFSQLNATHLGLV